MRFRASMPGAFSNAFRNGFSACRPSLASWTLARSRTANSPLSRSAISGAIRCGASSKSSRPASYRSWFARNGETVAARSDSA
jgi:hypothetical protein